MDDENQGPTVHLPEGKSPLNTIKPPLNHHEPTIWGWSSPIRNPSHRVLGGHRVLGIDPLDQRVPDEVGVSALLIQGLNHLGT